MEAVLKSDLKDIYRVKQGVLLIINKFKYITNDDDKGYYIELTDKSKWNFQITTEGDALSGNIGDITMLLNTIIGRILSDDVYEDQESN